MTTSIRKHERKCRRCLGRLWCPEIMDLIARAKGYLSWEFLAAEIRAGQMAEKEGEG